MNSFLLCACVCVVVFFCFTVGWSSHTVMKNSNIDVVLWILTLAVEDSAL